MSTLMDLKIRIVSVIGAEKNGCTSSDLCRMYKDLYGKTLRPEDHGFKDLQSLLISPIMQGEGGIIYENGRYFASADKNTRKLLNIVRNTKSRNSKLSRKFHAVAPVKFGKGGLGSNSAASTRSGFINAENRKLLKKPHVVEKEAIATKQMVARLQANLDEISKNAPQTNFKAAFDVVSRPLGYSHAFESQQARHVAPLQGLNNYQCPSNERSHNYDDYPAPLVSEIQRQSSLNSIKKDGMMKSQKGRKRLVNLIEQYGGEMNFSEMKNAYRHGFGVPLNSAEANIFYDLEIICRLFDVKENEIEDLSGFLKSHLYNRVAVTKQANNDILLTVIDDEDDIDEFENLSFTDIPTQRSLPSESFVMENNTFSPNQYRNEFKDCPLDSTASLGKAGTTAKSSLCDSQFTALTANDRFEYWKGSTLASAKIRSKDDCLPYKVLGDKILSFVRAKGSFKVSDLSEIFFEEDGRHIDPKNYKEGTWENIIKKLLSAGGHPELIVRDGILDLDRKDFQNFVSSSACSSNNWTDNKQNEKQSENGQSASLTVPAVIIYDLLMEAGRPLLLKELIEKLSAKGIKVNACQLTVKLITEFKDVFCCEFHSAGTSISILHGAKRPEEPAISSCLSSFTDSVKIVTHVMSDYCSTTESPSSIFKPILLVNIVLIDEPLGRFRIQAFFRLRTFERAYKLFEKKMCFHYLFYGEEKDYVVEKPVKDCNYAFHDIKDNQVYRVRCLDDGGHAGVVPVYFIDQMRHQNVPISQLRKLTNDYVKPAYGVVAKTAPFIIVSGREDEFRKSFSQICSKLLEHSEQDIQADVVSEPSKNLFELKQIFSEAHGGLKIPAAFMRQNLIQMFSN